MKIIVAHVSLNSAGGGERVCLSVIEALRKAGSRVTLATVDKTDWPALKRAFDDVTLPDDEFYLFKSLPTTSSNILNSALVVTLFWTELIAARFLRRHQLIINTCGEKVNSIADIAYLNGIPARYAYLMNTSAVRKSISVLYNTFQKAFDKSNNTQTIVNSGFHKMLFEKCMKKSAIAVYPPVDAQKFAQLAKKRRNGNTVAICSQYFSTQNLDFVPKIARIVDGAKFIIIGSAGPTSKNTVEELHRQISELSLEDRVKLLTNQPFSKLFELLSMAKVFLRTLHNEPFGISIVEAMAAGCVPVVPRDGGPWFDILDGEQGKYGYSYATIDEAAISIRTLLTNERLRTEISNRAQKRAMDFDSSFFEKKIQEIVRKTLKRNSSKAKSR